MSKKMLKRSLALGALMAFVITGSAWAGNTYWDTNEPTKLDGSAVGSSGSAVDGVYNFSHGLAHGFVAGHNNEGDTDKFLHVDLNGYTVKVVATDIALGDIGNEHCTLGFKIIDTSAAKNGKLILTSSNDGNGAIKGFGIIDVGTLKATGEAGHALFVQEGQANIYANNVELKAINDNVLQVDTTGKLILGKVDGETISRIDSLTIDASEGERPIRVSGEGNFVKIYANNLKIIRSMELPKESIKADKASSIIIDALEGTVDSNLEVDGKDSVIDVVLGSGANYTGQIEAKNSGEITFASEGKINIVSGKEEKGVYANGGTVTITGNKQNTVTFTGGGGEWGNGTSQAFASIGSGSKAVLKDFSEVVFDGEHAHSGLYAFNGGEVEVTGVGTIKQTETSSLGQAINAFGGKITVKADVIDLDTTGNGIFAQTAGANSGILTVEATTIDIKAGANAIGGSKMSSNSTGTVDVNVKADYITLEVEKNKAAVNTFNATDAPNPVPVYNDSKITVTANEKLSITGSNAVNARYGISSEKLATVTLKGKDIEIINNGSNNALRANTYGKIDANATNKMTINGNISSTGNSIVVVSAPTMNFEGVINVDSTSTVDLSNVKDFILKGLKADNTDAAIQVAEGGTLKVNNTETGTLAIDGAEAGNTYKVVQGVADKDALWSDANLAYDRTTMVATSNFTDDLYSVKYESFNDVSEVTDEIKDQFVAAVGGEEELAVPALVAASTGQGTVMEETAPGAKEFLAAVSSDAEMTKETKAAVINSAAQLAEAGGNAGTAVSVANNVAGVTTGRMSFGGRGHGGHKGGHGVGMFEEGSGAAVWAQYMHGKDDATDMPMDGGATSYESEYDGIVLGVDFKKVGKFQSGIAFNYGEGDSTGFTSAAKTKSDYDFWGIGYYGNIRNDDTNFIFDINYAKSDSDVTQHNAGATGDIEASPETTTWSAGVKVEKLYQNESVQIVPYTGLRYMSIDTDEYKSTMAGETLFNYAPERQDIWLLPLGVTIKQEVVNDNGWVVTPKVDLSYIWAFGDTDSNMSVSIPGIAASNDTLGFTVMDDGSFLGLVGVEAKLDDWTFGVSYSYQKGDYAESKKWFVDAKYSF